MSEKNIKKYYGCSGWYYNHWVEKFYPKGLSKSKWLNYYAEHFDTVEVNSTFYRMLQEKTFQGWYDKTPPEFVFTLKGSRYVTHIKKLRDVKEPIERFYELADLLKEKLGCILWQLPPSLHYNEERLESFCQLLNSSYKNVIEFRHDSWFTDAAYEILETNKVGYCIISSPTFPEILKTTSDIAYVRFHGKEWYRYDYSPEELEEWNKKLNRLKVKELYVYFNNDANAYAVKNCQTIKEMAFHPSPG